MYEEHLQKPFSLPEKSLNKLLRLAKIRLSFKNKQAVLYKKLSATPALHASAH